MKMQTSAIALSAAIILATPGTALAQDAATMQGELAQIRADMAAMAERIAQLEGELAQAEAKADAATTTANAANTAATEAAAAASEAAETASSAPAVEWKGAPKLSGDGGWSFKPRGRLNIDAGFISAPDSTGREDGFGSEMRRARLGVEGDIPGGFGYKFEVELSGGAEVTDAVLTYKTGDVKLTVGQHNNFQSLEELSSSRHTSFIERAAFTDAFGLSRRMGASFEYAKDDILVQAGVFSDNLEDLPNKRTSVDGRVVFFPKTGDTQLHFGGSVHLTDLEEGTTARYRQRPYVHFTGERFISTGNFSATSELDLGVEAAAISGPFHIAAEGYWRNTRRPMGLADPTFFGGYVEAGVFLTGGDSRGYKKGKFDRIKPTNPLNKGGSGAWSINARYDYLDLSDAGIIGGTQNGYQLSLIWTPTNYTRFLATYGKQSYDDAVHATGTGSTSYDVDAFGMRAQVDF